MATFYSNQYQNAYVDVPSTKIRPGDVTGVLMVLYFDFTIPGTAPIANDVFKLGRIPKGSRVIDMQIQFPDMGSAGLVDIGWAASADGVEAANATGFYSALDVNTAAIIASILEVPSAAGFCKLFDAEVDLELKVNTAWTVTSGTVKGNLQYRVI